MSRLSIVFWVLVFTFGLAATGSTAEISSPETGLEFGIASNLTLESYRSFSVAWKKRSSETRGWRMAVSLSGEVTSGEGDSSLPERNYEVDETRINGRWMLQRLFYTRPEKGVSGYWGVGPSVSHGQSDYERFYEIDRMRQRDTLSKSWTIGAAFSLGAEWRVLEQLAVAVEYGAYLDYFYHEYNDGYDAEEDMVYRTETTEGVVFGDGEATMSATLFF